MKNAKFNAEAELSIVLPSRKEVRAIATALKPEASHPAGEKANAMVVLRGQHLTITFRARDSASLRAIMTSYLRMLKATITVCGSLLEDNRRHRRRQER